MNLFDIMRGAGGGEAFSALGSQYGLSQEQIAKAVQAFMPAFSAGLKRSTADPFGLMEFMRKLALGGYPQAYQNPGWAFGPGKAQGQDALGFLFGSGEAQRALAAQASAYTGLTTEKLAEIMPALASIMMGGIAQQAAAMNPMLDAMMNQVQGSASGSTRTAKGPLDRYEEEQAESDAAAGFAQAQADMMKAGVAALQAGTAAWQKGMGEMMKTPGAAAAGGAKQPETGVPGGDLFGDLFEPGQRLGEAYQREMEAILARFRPDTTRN